MSTQLTTPNAAPTKAEQRLSRRALLSRVGALTGGAVLAGSALGLTTRANAQEMPMETPMASGTTDAMATGATMPIPGATVENPFGTLANLSNDIEILNFALVLEHLEADFYARVLAAHAARPYLRDRIPFVANKLASDEAIHVTAVTEQIRRGGGTPIGAYLGAAPRVKSRDYLQFAASIYGIEARHTGLIRFLSGRTFAPDDREAPFTAMQVVKRAAPYIVTTGLPSMPMSDSSMSDSSMKSGAM